MERHYEWHRAPWQHLTARAGQLPHALLLRGRPGIGKTVFARAFAQWLLCEGARSAEAACGACDACNWFTQANHPDFRQVEPEILMAAREDEPERSKDPSKQIKIEQVRDLQELLAVGTHRAGQRVVIVRPAEAMNTATANALLKSLEEPPPRTLFLLVSSRPARLLPTIRSRCQGIDLPAPAADQALRWLKAQGLEAAEPVLAHSGNAPLAAAEAAQTVEQRNKLLNCLARGEDDPLVLTDACAASEAPLVVDWLQKWVYDLAAGALGQAPRYHPQAASTLQKLSARVSLPSVLRYQRKLAQARAVAQHPLNPRLFLEDLFIDYRKAMG